MTTISTSTRRHDLDWLRVIAIVILLFFHTGMLFNKWEWQVKNNETSASFQYWMVWLHYWRMPLLLFISGASTVMAFSKRSAGQFVGERFKRLFIPLAFGIFVIVPPQIYFEHIDKYESYLDFYKTVFNFVVYPQGSFSWHHLWFIAYLLLFSLLGLPLLHFLRSKKSTGFKRATIKLLSRPAGILLIPFLFVLVTQLILLPFFPVQTYNVVTDWANFTFYFCFYIYGIIIYNNKDLWEALGKRRLYFLISSLFVLIAFYGLYFHFQGIIQLPFDTNTLKTSFTVISIMTSWFWVITIIAFGQHYLNKYHHWLKHFNEGIYPFYILHQTVIVTLGYYISQSPLSPFIKFWIVSLSTMVICLVIYFSIIRPFNLFRILFGMKPSIKKMEQKEVGKIMVAS